MNYNIDKNYLLETMEDFINTPSPVGYYEKIHPLLEKYASDLGHSVTYDRKRTGYITLDGVDSKKTVCVAAHLDTLGLVVKKINNDGSIKVTNVGGINFMNMEGETVTIHTRFNQEYKGQMSCISHSTHVFDNARTLVRDENTMVIRLDEIVNTKEDVEALGILSGDIVSVEPRFQYTKNGFINSRFIDNKASAAIILALLKKFKEEGLKPQYRTIFAFPLYEEISHGGAVVPNEVSEYVAMDIGVIGPDLNGSEFKVSICAKDNKSTYDRALTTKLIEQAKKCGADFAVDIFYRYGTDASAALLTGNDVYAAAFGMGTHSSHGMERTHISAVENTAKLLIAYVLGI